MFDHILVPTDFSECAGFARDAAVQFAKKFNSTIHLVHCLTEEEGSTGASQAEAKLNDSEEQVSSAGIRCSTYLERGKIHQVLESLVGNLRIDLICIGSFGASGFEELFIGSNTQKVLRHVHCPALVIKQSLNSIAWKSVLFASGFDEKDKPAFDYCVRFARATGGNKTAIHLLSVNTGSSFTHPSLVIESAMESFRPIARPLITKLHLFKGLTREAGIQAVSEKANTDLIAISNVHRGTFHRMLFGSTVEAVVNHTDLPVLCIDLERVEE